MTPASPYLEQLARRVILFDGAMGTSIQSYPLTEMDFGGAAFLGCIDYLSITRPAIIREIHDSFMSVGCDAIETNTFRANRLTLQEFGLGDQTLAINEAAARIARESADRAARDSGRPRFVAGSIGPSGKLPSGDDPDLSDWGYEDLAALFQEQAFGLLKGGVDLLLIETSQDILEVKAAIEGIQRSFADAGRRVPLQAQVTLDTSGAHALRHRYRRRIDHASCAARRSHRPQLFDRPGAHARAAPFPARTKPLSRQRDAERRATAECGRRGGLPDATGALRATRRRIRAPGGAGRWRLLRHDARAYRQPLRAAARRSVRPAPAMAATSRRRHAR